MASVRQTITVPSGNLGSTPPNYQATPNVSYFYDNLPNAKGKLTKVSSAVSTTEYTEFDILGRVKSHKQTTDGTHYTTGYTYNLAGALIEETYPSGRVVKNTLDTDGDLQQVQSRKANDTFRNYANAFNYTAAGAVTSIRLGYGRWENTAFNSRLQPTQIALGTSANSTSLLKLAYDYGTTDNNGNVKSQTITVAGMSHPLIQTYNYDSLNRLQSATETSNSAQTWKQTYQFDRYGNRRFDTSNNNTTTLPENFDTNVFNPTFNTANNRMSDNQGYEYDSAGNVTKDAANKRFAYDAENKQTSFGTNGSSTNGGTYSYDGDGKRIKKIVGTETTIFVYNASGQMVAEYATTAPTTPQISYLTSDTLGTPRINTDANGQVTARHDYLPFGEEIIGLGNRQSTNGYQTDNIRQKFTGYERDNETDLDFAQARYYSKNHGRFTTPDDFLNDSDINDPQSWGKYIYVRNNPLNFTDPTGQCTPTPGKPCLTVISTGVNHVPKQPKREVTDAANLGYKDTPTGGFALINVESKFAEGDNISDYEHVRAALFSGTIRKGGEENPSSDQTAIEGNSRFVTDNPGVSTRVVDSQGNIQITPKASALGDKTFTAIFVAGEYNKKTKQLSENVIYYGVQLAYDKNGKIDQKKSKVVTLTRDQFIGAANQLGVELPKDKDKKESPEKLLSPPN